MAVGRGPGTELARERAVVEVCRRLLGRLLDDGAGDADLPPELRPVDDQRRPRVLSEGASLLAVVVGEKAEAALVNASQQHHPRRGLTRSRAGGKRHRLREDLARRARVAEPGVELPQRIGIDGVFGEDWEVSYGS